MSRGIALDFFTGLFYGYINFILPGRIHHLGIAVFIFGRCEIISQSGDGVIGIDCFHSVTIGPDDMSSSKQVKAVADMCDGYVAVYSASGVQCGHCVLLGGTVSRRRKVYYQNYEKHDPPHDQGSPELVFPAYIVFIFLFFVLISFWHKLRL